MEAQITIVTPSYNQGKYIRATIESVLSQGTDGLEYIVMDGGSTDGTLDILQEYQDRITWYSEPDKGPADAINKGFRMGSARVLGWLNADDIYYEGALAKVLDQFRRNPELDLLYGDAHHIGEDGGILEQYPTEEWNFERLTNTCFISQPASFFSRRIFTSHGPLAETVRGMDYEFWLRLGQAGIVGEHLPEPLAATRIHPEAFTIAARVRVHKEINDFTRRILGRTPDLWLYNYTHAVLDSWGVPRNTKRFTRMVSILSVLSALRWNRRISREMWRTIVQWFRA